MIKLNNRVGFSKFHFLTGVITFLIFLLSGLYMRFTFTDILPGDDSVRFMYRANHVYILFGSLINVLIGTQLKISGKKVIRILQFSASILIIISQPVLISAFILDTYPANYGRVFTTLGVFSLFIGCCTHIYYVYKK